MLNFEAGDKVWWVSEEKEVLTGTVVTYIPSRVEHGILWPREVSLMGKNHLHVIKEFVDVPRIFLDKEAAYHCLILIYIKQIPDLEAKVKKIDDLINHVQMQGRVRRLPLRDGG